MRTSIRSSCIVLLFVALSQHVALAQLELVRDGQVVASGLWGLAVPVDPGDHNIVARAPGRIAWSGSVHVGPNGAGASASVPRLLEAPAGTPLAAASVTAPSELVPEPPALKPALAPEAAPSVQPIVGAALAGVGGVALIVGAVFGTRAIMKNNDAKDFCPGGGPDCSSYRGVELTEQADSAADVANVLMIGGGAALLGGAIVYLTSPSKAERSGLGLAVGTSSFKLTLTERF